MAVFNGRHCTVSDIHYFFIAVWFKEKHWLESGLFTSATARLDVLYAFRVCRDIPQDDLSIDAASSDDIGVTWTELEAEDVIRALQHQLRVYGVRETPEENQ